MNISNKTVSSMIEYASCNHHAVVIRENSALIYIEAPYSYVTFFPLSSGDVCIIKYNYHNSENNKVGNISFDEFKRLFAKH